MIILPLYFLPQYLPSIKYILKHRYFYSYISFFNNSEHILPPSLHSLMFLSSKAYLYILSPMSHPRHTNPGIGALLTPYPHIQTHMYPNEALYYAI